jgi:type IV pilus assembly protein PilB
MNPRSRKLGQILIEKGLITEDQLAQALDLQKKQRGRLGRILVDQGWISEDALLEALSERFEIPKVRIDAYAIDPEVVKTVPRTLAERYRVLPLFRVDDTLTLAMADPLDIYAIDAIRYHTGCRVQEVITTEKEIEQGIQRFYSVRDSIDEMVRDLSPTSDKKEVDLGEDIGNRNEEDASVISLVNMILEQAIRDRASDVHIEPDEGVLRIRFRIDGVLQEIPAPPKHLQDMITARLKIMADLDVSERRLPQDGRFRVRLQDKRIDVRTSILPTVHGEKLVLRVLDQSAGILGLEEMGFSRRILDHWRQTTSASEGMVLITGPTGSGKTSTLYAVLREINTVSRNIVTVENPVEYRFPMINQVQVNPKVGLTFAAALRSILRQDPDVIMIGEVRDLETAEIAIRSALTGHLVFSTLHTRDAAGAIIRLVDMGIEPFLAASSLNAVLAQRLVRTICPTCKEARPVDEETFRNSDLLDKLDVKELFVGAGCRECHHTGYRGRTGIHELLILDDDLRRLVVSNASTDELREAAVHKGMVRLREDGLYKVRKGITTVDEVMRVT